MGGLFFWNIKIPLNGGNATIMDVIKYITDKKDYRYSSRSSSMICMSVLYDVREWGMCLLEM